MFNSNVKAVLLYTFESWTITQRTLGKFQVFINKCIQKIANIHWPDRIYSNELCIEDSKEPVQEQFRRRK